jgi:hypothetical protein
VKPRLISTRTNDNNLDVETNVKILLSAVALVGSLGLLLTDWAGQAVPYL